MAPSDTVLSPRALIRIREEQEFIESLRVVVGHLEAKQQKTADCLKNLEDVIALSNKTIEKLEAGEWP